MEVEHIQEAWEKYYTNTWRSDDPWNRERCLTVGQLKTLLEMLPDDTKIVERGDTDYHDFRGFYSVHPNSIHVESAFVSHEDMSRMVEYGAYGPWLSDYEVDNFKDMHPYSKSIPTEREVVLVI